MKQSATTKQKKQSDLISRYAYFLYLLLVIYQLLIGDIEWAVANLGIAMVFDPFDSSVRWPDRPLYQRVWLLSHLTLVIAGLLYLIIQ